jgi:hypothetical protein
MKHIWTTKKGTRLLLVITGIVVFASKFGQAHVEGAGSCLGPGDSGGQHPAQPYRPPPEDGGFRLERHEVGALYAGQETLITLRAVGEGLKYTGFLVTAFQGFFLSPELQPNSSIGPVSDQKYQLAEEFVKYKCLNGGNDEAYEGSSRRVSHTESSRKAQTVFRFQAGRLRRTLALSADLRNHMLQVLSL